MKNRQREREREKEPKTKREPNYRAQQLINSVPILISIAVQFNLRQLAKYEAFHRRCI